MEQLSGLPISPFSPVQPSHTVPTTTAYPHMRNDNLSICWLTSPRYSASSMGQGLWLTDLCSLSTQDRSWCTAI